LVRVYARTKGGLTFFSLAGEGGMF